MNKFVFKCYKYRFFFCIYNKLLLLRSTGHLQNDGLFPGRPILNVVTKEQAVIQTIGEMIRLFSFVPNISLFHFLLTNDQFISKNGRKFSFHKYLFYFYA